MLGNIIHRAQEAAVPQNKYAANQSISAKTSYLTLIHENATQTLPVTLTQKFPQFDPIARILSVELMSYSLSTTDAKPLVLRFRDMQPESLFPVDAHNNWNRLDNGMILYNGTQILPEPYMLYEETPLKSLGKSISHGINYSLVPIWDETESNVDFSVIIQLKVTWTRNA